MMARRRPAFVSKRRFIIIAFVLACSGGLLSGRPQQLAVEAVLSRALGANVQLVDAAFLGSFRAGEIRVYPREETFPGFPVVVARDVRVEYGLFDGELTQVHAVHVGDLHFDLDSREPENPNYAFFLDLISRGDSEQSSRSYLPTRIDIDRIGGRLRVRDGTISFSGVSAQGTRSATQEEGFDAGIRSESFTASIILPEEHVELNVKSGTFSVEAAITSSGARALILAKMPEYLDLAGIVESKAGTEGSALSADFATCVVEGMHLQPLLEYLIGYPVKFESLDASGLRWSKGHDAERSTLPKGMIDLAIRGLAVGEAEHTLYRGELRVIGELGDEGGSEGTLRISLEGNQEIMAKVFEDTDAGGYTMKALLNEIDAAPWSAVLAGGALPHELEGIVQGTIDVAAPSNQPIRVDFALSSESLSYDDNVFNEVRLTGAANIARSWLTLHGASGLLESGEMGSVSWSDWSYDTGDRKGGGRIDFTVDAEAAGGMLDLPDFWGEVRGHAQANIDGDRIVIPIFASTDYLGYGDLGVPYGSELSAEATLEWDLEAERGSIRESALRLGEDTRVNFDSMDVSLAPFVVNGSATLQSDLRAAVDMGWLEEVNGSLLAKGEFEYTEQNGFSATWEAGLESNELRLSLDVASVSGLSVSASGTYREGLRGEGLIAAKGLSIAGATLHNLTGSLTFFDRKVASENVTGQIFEGEIVATVRIGLLEEGIPIDLSAAFDSIRLDRLTEEVELPSVSLTGLAGGSASIQYRLMEGLDDFTLYAYSSQDLSVNRDLIEDLLTTQDFLGSLGRDKVEKTLAKFLGEAPQRPFDDGELDLSLEDGRIVGKSVLHSGKTKDYNGLNLLVDLAIDAEALGESLKLLQQEDLEQVNH